jgi:integrase/recombinase XerD
VEKAHLYIRVRMTDGKYFTSKPAFTKNGRIRTGFALVKKSPKEFPSYTYVLRHANTWETIGTDPSLALAALDRKNHDIKSVNLGIKPRETASSNSGSRSKLKAACADYLDEVKANKKHKTLDTYRYSLAYFQESCTKVYLDEVERKDMLDYKVFLRDKGLSQRSICNRFKHVLMFLRSQGITELVRKTDFPDYTLNEPEIYSPEDLSAFFAACDPLEKVCFQFFLCTGMREKEVAHTFWTDVNFSEGTVKVSAKEQYKWNPKAYKERTIPVPDSLLAALNSIKPSSPKGLIFCNSAGSPKRDFLMDCKAIAERAGFKREDFFDHRFRATFASMHLQAGVDIRTVQSWLGHSPSSIGATMRYLQPARGAAARAKANATFQWFGNG